MKKVLLVALAIMACAGPVLAGNISQSNPNSVIWYDMFSDPNDRSTIWDGYVEAEPGDTVIAYIEVNNNWAGWLPISAYRVGVWWDDAALDRPTSYTDYSPDLQIAEDGVTTYGSTTQIYPGAVYPGAAYEEVEIRWSGNYGYNYEMRLVAWSFPVREDAPLGITTVGCRTFMYDYFGYYWRSEYRVENDDPFALKINVIPEPATLSLLAIAGPAVLRRRKKQLRRSGR